MPNEDLLKPLKNINKSIAKIREEVISVRGEVEKIREFLRKATQRIEDAIQENIRAQAELKLMEHVMEVRTVKPQIEAEHDQIETERSELEERLESIGERYERKHAELDETASERIRDVGEHIFEIEEEQFETGIEEPFTEQVTTTWQALQAHNETVREERTSDLRGTTGDVVQTIYDYIDRQEQLIDEIRSHRLDDEDLPLSTDRETRLQVPYYVVEYEVDGITERQVVVPARVTGGDDDWCSASLSPIDGAEPLVQGADGPTSVASRETLRESALADALEPHSESPLLGESYADAVADAVPDDGVPVAVEGDGGEN